MMAKTHVVIGVSYAVAILPAVEQGDFTPLQFGLILSGLVIGSLLPDIDHPHSVISRQIPLVGGIISRLTRHRGLFHSILGFLILFVLLQFPFGFLKELFQSTDPFYVPAGILIGYFLHIVADMLTVSKVRLLYPLQWNVGLGIFKTGGMREMALRWFLTGVVLLQVLSLFNS